MVSPNEGINNSLLTPTTLEMMELFKNNPNIIDTAEGLAKRLGTTKEKIDFDIINLVNLGVLKTKYVGKTPILYVDKKRTEEIDSVSKRTLFTGRIQLIG
jgi:predicted HTH transcriptional regulator